MKKLLIAILATSLLFGCSKAEDRKEENDVIIEENNQTEENQEEIIKDYTVFDGKWMEKSLIGQNVNEKEYLLLDVEIEENKAKLTVTSYSSEQLINREEYNVAIDENDIAVFDNGSVQFGEEIIITFNDVDSYTFVPYDETKLTIEKDEQKEENGPINSNENEAIENGKSLIELELSKYGETYDIHFQEVKTVNGETVFEYLLVAPGERKTEKYAYFNEKTATVDISQERK